MPLLAVVERLAREQQHAEADRAFVTLTYAQSLDGCIARKPVAAASAPQLILSSPESMKLTHELRAFHDGILVGVDTVVLDNPSLTTRLVKGPNPRPIILDRQLRCPMDCKLLSSGGDGVVVVCGTGCDGSAAMQTLQAMGNVTVLVEDDLSRLFVRLKRECGIHRVMAEGGARVIASLYARPELVDCVLLTIAPFFLGSEGLSPSSVLSTPSVAINILASSQLGSDVCIVGTLRSTTV